MCIVVTLWSKYTNGLSTERKLVGPFRLSYKTVVKDDCLERIRALKMIVWKEQEPEPELSVKHLKFFNRPLFFEKLVATFFWYGLKPVLLLSHILVDHVI